MNLPGPRPLVGMVHLLPLPGAPRWAGSMRTVIDRALADAGLLEQAGFQALLIENFGDAPFFPSRVPAETVAAMGVVIHEIRRTVPLPAGVNVLRNDARAALAIAAATGAEFMRVNVHSGALLTDQGWIRGRAYHTLRMRARLGLQCGIVANVAVKHAILPPGHDIAAEARDARDRGLANALIVSGPATGQPPDPAHLLAVRRATAGTPLWIGSGLDCDNVASLLPLCDGAIVGSTLQKDGVAGSGVEAERAQRFINAVRALP